MKHRAVLRLLAGLTTTAAALAGETQPTAPPAFGLRPSAGDRYLQAVQQFADNVLTHGRDRMRHTPLLVDGINVDTREPAIWRLPEDCARVWKMPRQWVMSNLASQQNLFRVLDALTTITGDSRYRKTAVEATRYAFEHLCYEDGLLFWGGHCLIDLATGRPVGESHKDWSKGIPIPPTWDTGLVHELKHHFPYYELMWQVDAAATRRFIEAFWGSHIQNWSNLDMNRHGIYGRGAGPGWDHAYVGGPVPFTGKGLSILHGGSDLIYSAGMLTLLSDDERPLTWARRLARRYVESRHPVTGLGPDLYSFYRNERMLAQFGPEWGDRINESTIVSIYGARYGDSALGLLKLAERLGPRGEEFSEQVTKDLLAYAKHAYDASDNSFWSMLTDGTRLSPEVVKRPGSLTPGTFHKRGARAVHLWVYVLAAQAGGDPLLGKMARSIGRAMGLGDLGGLGPADTDAPRLDMATRCTDPEILFALLDMHRLTGRRQYLELAKHIGDNLMTAQFHHGFFVATADHLYCRFDTITPLALLHLHEALNGRPDQAPFYPGGSSYFHCDYEGKGRSYDGAEIFSQKRLAHPAVGDQPHGGK